METNQIDVIDVLDRLQTDAVLQSDVAQLKAKSTLVEVLGAAPAYRWSYVPERIVRNAVAAGHCLERLALSGEEPSQDFSGIARRFALAWESLSTLREGGTNRELALLNAAAAYDFAGHQANAICLGRKVVQETSNLFNQVVGLTISRRYMNVAHQEWESNVLSGVEINSQEDAVFAAAVAVATAALQELSRFFLSGSEAHLESAKQLLEQAESPLMILGAAEEASLVRTFKALTPVMERRSTWKNLGQVSAEPKWQRYLALLARSLAQSPINGTSITELWPSQQEALRGGLLSDDGSKIIRMPTSAGKTRIAEMALVHTLVEQPGAKCIYVAPYRALVSEIESTLIAVLSDLGFQVSTALGGFETDEIELFNSRNADVLVTTPEKLDLLNRLTPEYAEQVRLVILDEGHILGDPRRGVKYDMLLTRFKLVAPQARFIFLSAVVPLSTLEELAEWLNAGPNSTLQTEWRPSVQRLAALRWSGSTGTLHFDEDPDAPLLSETFTPGIIRQQVIRFPNPATNRMLTRRFPDSSNKSQIAAELALKFMNSGSVLVFCSVPQFTTAVGQAVVDRIDWSALAQLTDAPPPVHTSATRSAQMAAEWLGVDHKVTQLLCRGVAVHYGALPDPVRNAVEADFRDRKYKILVATNTLAQGVNLPIRTVIVHSVWRGPQDARQRVSARDYWNIAGRAGRAGEETEGTIIHIVRTPLDSADYDFYRIHRSDPEPVDSGLLRLLQEVLDGRLSDEAFRGVLDPEILAYAVEETVDSPMSTRIENLVDNTLAARQTRRTRIPQDLLRRKSVEIADHIVREVPDVSRRKIFASTGLTTGSCLYLEDYIIKHQSEVSTIVSGRANPIDAARSISELAAELQEAEVDEAFSGSFVDLLRLWMQGQPISEIRRTLGNDAPNIEQLASFIENHFGGRLPWVASGFLRLASGQLQLGEDSLPLQVRTLPAMIKIGVGFPEAAWAAAAGVASREAAMRVGNAYIANRSVVPGAGQSSSTFTDFLEWLRPMTAEELNELYGLEGAVLEETLNALRRNNKNPFLTEDVNFPLEFEVRGVSIGGRRHVAARAMPGIDVYLQRDYDNLVDRNAVFVVLGDEPIGYVPRDVAQLIAPELDAGGSKTCKVVSNVAGGTPAVRVQIEN